MLQPELEAQQSYRLSTDHTVPVFSASLDQSPPASDPAMPHRQADAHIVISLSHSLPQPKSPPTKKPRRRGLVITQRGWQKLLEAGVVHNQFGERYTFAKLSEQTLLDPRTICRIIGREEAVDKRSLGIFFDAFGLRLEKEDYTIPEAEVDTGQKQKDVTSPPPTRSTDLAHEFHICTEELATIRKRITEECCLLMLLLGLEGVGQITVSVTLQPQAEPQLELSIRQ